MPDAQQQLVSALRAVLDELGEPVEVQPGVFAGDNLAERLSAALTDLAREHQHMPGGGAEALVRHRPGCWEAEHIRALAAGWDW